MTTNNKRIHSILKSFNVGATPTITCFNKATVPLGVDLSSLVAGLQRFADDHVVPVWGTPAKIAASSGFLKGAWAIVFLDDADAANALGYHELTPDGLPIAKVFVRTIRSAGEPVSITASHELVEMLVDPAINLYSAGPDPKSMYAYESADPVEEEVFDVNGFPMSDFVYPSYFEDFHKPGSTKFDHLGKLSRPFQLLPGGYQIVFRDGQGSEIFGSSEKARRFAAEDRRQHRSAERGQRRAQRSQSPEAWGKMLVGGTSSGRTAVSAAGRRK